LYRVNGLLNSGDERSALRQAYEAPGVHPQGERILRMTIRRRAADPDLNASFFAIICEERQPTAYAFVITSQCMHSNVHICSKCPK